MIAGIFGNIKAPLNNQYFSGTKGEGLFLFLSNILQLAAVIAGIYMVVQFILAGFNYISASGDAKKTEAAWNQIWQSIVGLVIIASAFVITGLVERFTGIKILQPVIPTP